MAQIKQRFVKIAGTYQVAPDYNLPSGGKWVDNLDEVKQEISKWQSKTDDWSQNYVKELQRGLSEIQAGTSPYAIDEKGVLTTQKALAEQQAQREALAAGTVKNIGTANAPLTVPLGTPTPEESNKAFQATQPKPQYQEYNPKTGVISTDMLSGGQKLDLQQKPDTTNYQNTYGAGTITAPTTKEDTTSDYLKSYLAGAEPPKDPTAKLQEIEAGQGITAKEQGVIEAQRVKNLATAELDMINAEIKGITTAGQQAQLQLEQQASGKDITSTFLGRQQQEISRQTAIKILPLQSQALVASSKVASAQGDLDLAQGILSQAENKVNAYFQIQSDYQKDLYNYKKDLRDKVFEYATAQEQRLLAQQDKEDTRDHNMMINNLNQAQSWASTAITNGQGALAGEIMALDPKSKTYQQDLANLAGQIREKDDPMKDLDLAIKRQQLLTAQKQYDMLGQLDPQEQEKEDKIEREKLATVKGQIQVLEDKKSLADSILDSSALGGRVGTNLLSRKLVPSWWNPVSWISGAIDQTKNGASFAGNVHRLTSQEFLDKLIEAKSQGATFGALTDREGDALRSVATQINDWEMKKDGKGIGIWEVDEQSFIREINRIKDLANTSILRAQGTIFTPEERSLLDNLWSSQDASNFYK